MKVEDVELLLVLLIVVFQIYIFVKTYKKIQLYKGIIPLSNLLKVTIIYVPNVALRYSQPKEILSRLREYKDESEKLKSDFNFDLAMANSQGLTEITILESNYTRNSVFNNIVLSINNYLIRNRNAASDFSLIKDIVERNTDATEEEINLTISIPLYLGLLGTMLGIVIGLINMSDISNAVKGNISDESLGNGISILLGGVKIAMFASFTGLLLTIINSGWIFKGSRSQIDQNKNEFYTFLQIELLPVMNQGLGQTFESLQRNLLRFNGEFTTNLNKLTGIFDKNHDTLKLQHELLELIDRSKVSEMTRYNVKVLQELNSATLNFEKFNEYFGYLDKYIGHSFQLTDKLNLILDRTETFKAIADNLDNKLNQSQQLIDFLTKHFNELEMHKKYVSDSVAEVAHGINDVFGELREHIQGSSQSIKDFTVEEIDALKTALSESRTNLGNLQFLESINKEMGQIRNNSSTQNDKIRNQIEETNRILTKSIKIQDGLLENSSKQLNDGFTEKVKKLFPINKFWK